MKIDLEYYDDAWNRDVNGLNFRGIVAVENNTGIIKDLWFRLNCAWGTAKYTAWFDVIPGTVTGTYSADTSKYDPKNGPPNQDYRFVPAGTRQVTVEGRRSSKNTLVSALILPLAA